MDKYIHICTDDFLDWEAIKKCAIDQYDLKGKFELVPDSTLPREIKVYIYEAKPKLSKVR